MLDFTICEAEPVQYDMTYITDTLTDTDRFPLGAESRSPACAYSQQGLSSWPGCPIEH